MSNLTKTAKQCILRIQWKVANMGNIWKSKCLQMPRMHAFQCLMWPVDDIFVLPGVVTLLCFNTVCARIVVVHLLLSVHLPGTHSVMICIIWHLALTV